MKILVTLWVLSMSDLSSWVQNFKTIRECEKRAEEIMKKSEGELAAGCAVAMKRPAWLDDYNKWSEEEGERYYD